MVLTWEGCSEQDESYRLFVQKLRNEIQPENEKLMGAEPLDAVPRMLDAAGADRSQERARELARGRQWGDQLGLHATGELLFNWGGLNEKWLRGTGQSGTTSRPRASCSVGTGRSNMLSALTRCVPAQGAGRHVARRHVGRAVWARHRRRPARTVFTMIRSGWRHGCCGASTTGPEMLAAMSSPGGAMWPAGDEPDEAAARSRAATPWTGSNGTFFGPEPYAEFAWTADDLPRVLRDATLRATAQGLAYDRGCVHREPGAHAV